MDTVEVQQLADDLDEFVTDVFASLTRSGWQERAGDYLRGLMLDGRRKSIQPMAARLAGPHEQALNHFVTNSPWDAAEVRKRFAVRSAAPAGPPDDGGPARDESQAGPDDRAYAQALSVGGKAPVVR
nr:transposase [Actinoplanes sp. M2I2]